MSDTTLLCITDAQLEKEEHPGTLFNYTAALTWCLSDTAVLDSVHSSAICLVVQINHKCGKNSTDFSCCLSSCACSNDWNPKKSHCAFGSVFTTPEHKVRRLKCNTRNDDVWFWHIAFQSSKHHFVAWTTLTTHTEKAVGWRIQRKAVDTFKQVCAPSRNLSMRLHRSPFMIRGAYSFAPGTDKRKETQDTGQYLVCRHKRTKTGNGNLKVQYVPTSQQRKKKTDYRFYSGFVPVIISFVVCCHPKYLN